MRFVPGVHLLSATNSASFANRTYPLPISVTTYGRVLYGSGLSPQFELRFNSGASDSDPSDCSRICRSGKNMTRVLSMVRESDMGLC